MNDDDTRRMSRDEPPGQPPPKPRPQSTRLRLARQAEELRANLRRRKEKARVLPAGIGDAIASPAGTDGGESGQK